MENDESNEASWVSFGAAPWQCLTIFWLIEISLRSVVNCVHRSFFIELENKIRTARCFSKGKDTWGGNDERKSLWLIKKQNAHTHTQPTLKCQVFKEHLYCQQNKFLHEFTIWCWISKDSDKGRPQGISFVLGIVVVVVGVLLDVVVAQLRFVEWAWSSDLLRGVRWISGVILLLNFKL